MNNKVLFLFLFVYALTFILLLVFMDKIYAITSAEARSQAVSLGGSSNFNPVSNENKKLVPGHSTDNPPQTKYYSGSNMEKDAADKIENTTEGRLISHDLANRPQIQVNLNDSFLNRPRSIENDAEQNMGMMTGSYDQCIPIDKDVVEDFEIKTCDQYKEHTASSCLVGNIVDITKGDSYQCNIKRVVKEKSCDKNLKLQCTRYGYLHQDKGFAVISGQHSNRGYPHFSMNIPRIGGWCAVHQRVANILVKDIDLIDSFILSNIQWDDSIEISLNGHIVYRNWHGCERGRIHWVSLNREMKQYLVKGNNRLVMKVSVSGLGHANVNYILKQRQCTSWQEEWEEICRG